MNPSACIKIVVSRPRGQALERLGFHAGRSRCLDPPGPRVQNRVVAGLDQRQRQRYCGKSMTRVRPGNNGYTHRIRVSHRVKGLFRRTQCAFAIRSHQSDSRPAIEDVVDVEGAFMRHREIELGTADLQVRNRPETIAARRGNDLGLGAVSRHQ